MTNYQKQIKEILKENPYAGPKPRFTCKNMLKNSQNSQKSVVTVWSRKEYPMKKKRSGKEVKIRRELGKQFDKLFYTSEGDERQKIKETIIKMKEKQKQYKKEVITEKEFETKTHKKRGGRAFKIRKEIGELYRKFRSTQDESEQLKIKEQIKILQKTQKTKLN